MTVYEEINEKQSKTETIVHTSTPKQQAAVVCVYSFLCSVYIEYSHGGRCVGCVGEGW